MQKEKEMKNKFLCCVKRLRSWLKPLHWNHKEVYLRDFQSSAPPDGEAGGA